jgi:hypothetical protein
MEVHMIVITLSSAKQALNRFDWDFRYREGKRLFQSGPLDTEGATG